MFVLIVQVDDGQFNRCFFFFQAEDGIRDLVRSRGLGDVYKRQVKAGLDAKAIAPRLTFFFNVHNDFLEEIAKFRAARTLWALSLIHI